MEPDSNEGGKPSGLHQNKDHETHTLPLEPSDTKNTTTTADKVYIGYTMEHHSFEKPQTLDRNPDSRWTSENIHKWMENVRDMSEEPSLGNAEQKHDIEGLPSGKSEPEGSSVQKREEHQKEIAEPEEEPEKARLKLYVQNWLKRTVDEIKTATLNWQKPSGTQDHGIDAMHKGSPSHLNYKTISEEEYENEKSKGGVQGQSPRHQMRPSSDVCESENDPKPNKSRATLRPMINHPTEPMKPLKRSDTSVPNSNDSDAAGVTASNEFEKRKRRKTREDHYEPNKKVKTIVGNEKGLRRKNTKRTRDRRRKAAGTSGEELLHTFSSNSIGNDRLTIRPINALGLFKNGRASSPAHRRGLPDLAFSEMDFLRRSTRHDQCEKEEKPISKSRDKEDRKRQRARNEISSYFTPTTAVRGHKGDGVTKAHLPDAPAFKPSQNRDHLSDITSSFPGSNLIAPPSHFPDKDHNSSTTRLKDLARYKSVDNINGQRKKLSDGATAYCSWSESCERSNSPSAGIMETISMKTRSPTPSTIRRSLEETGIFRHSEFHPSKAKVSKPSRDKAAETLQEDQNLEANLSVNADPSNTDPHTQQRNQEAIGKDCSLPSTFDRADRHKIAQDLYVEVPRSIPKDPNDRSTVHLAGSKTPGSKEVGTQTHSDQLDVGPTSCFTTEKDDSLPDERRQGECTGSTVDLQNLHSQINKINARRLPYLQNLESSAKLSTPAPALDPNNVVLNFQNTLQGTLAPERHNETLWRGESISTPSMLWATQATNPGASLYVRQLKDIKSSEVEHLDLSLSLFDTNELSSNVQYGEPEIRFNYPEFEDLSHTEGYPIVNDPADIIYEIYHPGSSILDEGDFGDVSEIGGRTEHNLEPYEGEELRYWTFETGDGENDIPVARSDQYSSMGCVGDDQNMVEVIEPDGEDVALRGFWRPHLQY